LIVLHKLIRSKPQHSLRRLALAAALCVAPLSISIAQSNLPQLGDGEEMSVPAERKLGQRIAREIYRDPDYLDDPLLTEYVQDIWQPLVRAGRSQGHITPELQERFAWEVMLARDRTVNAFALPGGYLGVHLGLIAIVASRDELASVLAHELSHVTQRHIARSTSKQAQQAPWLLGAMILGVLAASKNPEVANATIAGSQAVSAQSQLNFSRDMEREADRIGFTLMEGAGFDAQGFVGMFDKLQLANRINDNGSYPYLRTHPLTSERLGDMQSRLQLAQDAGAHKKPPGITAEHAIMAARARILADPSVDVLRSAVIQARSVPLASNASSPVQLASLYAGALAAFKLRDLDTAQQFATRAASAANLMANGPLAQENRAQRAINLIAQPHTARAVVVGAGRGSRTA
jgi:predicted Zn-dependent protease